MSKATLVEQIKGDLDYLKLVRTAEVFAELADDAESRGADHLEFLANVLSAEVDATRQRRLSARLRFAHFPFRKTLEEFDFDFQPSIDPKVISDLAELDFVRDGHPVLLLGRPGCGKSHLGVALGIKAVEAGYRGYFSGATDMTKALVSAWAEGTFNQKIRKYTSPSILVIDDVGITPFERTEANAFSGGQPALRVALGPIVTTNRSPRPGPSCSGVFPLSRPPSWTAWSTGRRSSTSRDRRRASASTRPSPSRSRTWPVLPRRPRGGGASLSPGARTQREFR